jgi:hypothetical protein
MYLYLFAKVSNLFSHPLEFFCFKPDFSNNSY